MKEEELKQHFEALFGQSYEHGRTDVQHLIKKAMRMGKFAEGSGINWHGKTTVSDMDFWKLSFFAMIGAGFVGEILGEPARLEAKKHEAPRPSNDYDPMMPGLVDGTEMFPEEGPRAGQYVDPRTIMPALADSDLEVRHRGGPDDVDDVAMSNDPRRPDQLYRCGTCSKDMQKVNGVDLACVNQSCPDYHQAIEIEIEVTADG